MLSLKKERGAFLLQPYLIFNKKIAEAERPHLNICTHILQQKTLD